MVHTLAGNNRAHNTQIPDLKAILEEAWPILMHELLKLKDTLGRPNEYTTMNTVLTNNISLEFYTK